jgi:diguanylate cyclase (GGDEF)-like protein/excisionase family DNA binding protein
MATNSTTTRHLLTVSDAARLLGVHVNTVRAWTDQGTLTCQRINRRGDRRYSRAEIDRFVARANAGESPRAHRRQGDGASAHSRLTARTAQLAAAGNGLDRLIADVARVMCSEGGYRAATYIAADGSVVRLIGNLRADQRLSARAVRTGQPSLGRARSGDGRYRVALPVLAGDRELRVLLLEGSTATRTHDEPQLLATIATQLEMAHRTVLQSAESADRHRRAELLMAVSHDIGSNLDPADVLRRLVERVAELFDADRAAILSRMPDGTFQARVARNLSTDFVQCVEHAASLPMSTLAFETRRIVTVSNYPDDPRALELRPALVHEGINTISVAPLISDGEPIGVLALYHDQPYEWSVDDLALFERLAQQGAALMRNAVNYSQMATWAAQLQSIQQLGARLTRLRSVSEIGQAICTELNQLINSHNIRVYRVEGDECLPVAWRGEVGEYEGEDGDQLRVKVGQGITGWVARHGLAQNLGDAAADRRTQTIPGTEDGLDESLLLAPMLYEDEVIGVIVLAKLGLNQFSADDLRLLEIYASIAAQAMANADATERLRAQSEALKRQVNSQRELLRVTESILGTLDTQALLEEIAERLKTLVEVDNICVSLHDQRTHKLRAIFARGVHEAEFLNTLVDDDAGISGEVIRTGEAQLVQDELSDPRVAHFASTGPIAGALVVAPLRSADQVQGLLVLERLGDEARFSDEEFELIKLFAAHVSIALRNAATHRAVELRAETDPLTGLWNHGALTEHIDRLVEQGTRFSMLMVDLDFFKVYNDHLGHQAGNVMLQRVARVLRSACRDSDRVFRFGGDEFALVLPNTSMAGARSVAEKLHAAVAAINDEAPPTIVPVTCSVGIAVFPRDGRDGASVILAADRACYAGKRAGRDRIATAAEGLALASDFRPTEPTQADQAEASYSAA